MTVTTGDATGVEVPAELLEKGNELAQRYGEVLTQRLEAPVDPGAARLGESPLIFGPFDVFATTPIQFITNPPYFPSKIIAGGECALILVFVIVAGNQGIALSQRDYTVNVERCSLTTCGAGFDQSWTGTFPSPAPLVTVVPFWFVPPVPPQGKPDLVEANVTVDILNPVQPYAAFATAIFDADNQFLVRVNELNRYLVYAR